MAEAAQRPAERVVLDEHASLWPRFVMVLDTDGLLSTIAYECRTGERTRLRQVLARNLGRTSDPGVAAL